MTTTIPIAQLVCCTVEENPNVMSAAEQAALTHAIATFGFTQPIEVTPRGDGTFTVIDGVHRVESATALGMTAVPALVHEGLSPQEVVVRRISLNKNRGHLDLGIVRAQLAEAIATTVEPLDLTATGFSEDEINALLSAGEADFNAGSMDGDDEEPAKNERPHEVVLTFRTKKDADAVRKGLRRASGKHKDMSAGALALLGLDVSK